MHEEATPTNPPHVFKSQAVGILSVDNLKVSPHVLELLEKCARGEMTYAEAKTEVKRWAIQTACKTDGAKDDSISQ